MGTDQTGLKMLIVSSLTILLIPLCFLLYLKGFFPIKDISNGLSKTKIIPSLDPVSEFYSKNENSSFHPFIYKRMVFMIIDALRDDFAKADLKYLPKTIKHLRRGHGLTFTAQTHPPTVTLPRIKAITTGSIPGFIDVVLNFGSTALTEDNIVTQMKMNNKKIVFYGDDTWLNLFPEHFDRYDGTSSFFVTDFTEVDLNVTRHLPSQLKLGVDWDIMILHYLGLDHIGHVSGPNSPLIRPKLREMDDVIDQIYTAMEIWDSESGIPSLLVVCGDHGMSDQGGHGGSSPSEILVPLIFLSPTIKTKDSFYKGLVSQTDLCPTIAMLLGLPVPLNSLGKVITDTLVGYRLPQKVSVLYQNAQQVLSVFKKFVKDFEREPAYILFATTTDEYKKWLKVGKEPANDTEEWQRAGQHLLNLYSESLSLMAERVGKLSSQYDVYAMATSITLLWLILISIMVTRLKRDLTIPEASISKYFSLIVSIVGSAFMSHIIMCTGGLPSVLMCGASPFNISVQLFVAGVLICCVVHLALTCGKVASWRQQIVHLTTGKTMVEWFLIVATICHTFTLLSSSFVEEEHQTFYFLTTSIHLLLILMLGIRYIKSRHLLHELNIDLSHLVKATEYHSIHAVNNEQCSADKTELDRNYSGRETRNDIDDTMESKEQYEAGGLNSYDVHQDSTSTSLVDDFKEIRYADTNKQLSKEGAKTNQEMGILDVADAHAGNSANSVNLISAKEAVHACVSLVVILVFLRILRRWNQTGNKWINEPDFGDWLMNPNNKPTLSLVALLSLVVIGASRSLILPRLHITCVNLSLVCAYMSRAASGALVFPDRRFITHSGVMEARISYMFMGLTVLLSFLPLSITEGETDNSIEEKRVSSNSKGNNNLIKSSGNVKPGLHVIKSRKNNKAPTPTPQVSESEGRNLRDLFSVKRDLSPLLLHTNQDRRLHIINGITTSWLCFMCLVLRPHNIPVVAMMSLIEQMAVHAVIKLQMKPVSVLLYFLWMGHAFFFFQGNSNSISTVDVSAGYVGVTEYSPVTIGLLMALSTYSGLIFWLLSFLKIMCLIYPGKEGSHRLKNVLLESMSWLSLKMLFPLAVYCIVVATQRYHLFVWTVFSPKLLYQAMETLVLSVVALGFYGGQYLVT